MREDGKQQVIQFTMVRSEKRDPDLPEVGNATKEQVGRRCGFPLRGLANQSRKGNWVFAESEGAYAAVRVVDGGYSWEDESPEPKENGWSATMSIPL